MFCFSYLNKEQKYEYLPILYDLLYSNMSDIAPTEFEKNEFVKEIGEALEKSPRQIILCYYNEDWAGFLMYYTRENMIMIEELQLVKEYQRTRLLHDLCKHMIRILPQNIEYIEAFAHKENSTSLSLQKWLGMVIIDETNKKLFHLRGDVNTFKSKIR